MITRLENQAKEKSNQKDSCVCLIETRNGSMMKKKEGLVRDAVL